MAGEAVWKPCQGLSTRSKSAGLTARSPGWAATSGRRAACCAMPAGPAGTTCAWPARPHCPGRGWPARAAPVRGRSGRSSTAPRAFDATASAVGFGRRVRLRGGRPALLQQVRGEAVARGSGVARPVGAVVHRAMLPERKEGRQARQEAPRRDPQALRARALLAASAISDEDKNGGCWCARPETLDRILKFRFPVPLPYSLFVRADA